MYENGNNVVQNSLSGPKFKACRTLPSSGIVGGPVIFDLLRMADRWSLRKKSQARIRIRAPIIKERNISGRVFLVVTSKR